MTAQKNSLLDCPWYIQARTGFQICVVTIYGHKISHWHVTCDTWHMTFDKWWGVNVLSKFQLPSSNGLGSIMFWIFGGKRSLTDWLNELMSNKAVCRTPGLFNISTLLMWETITLFRSFLKLCWEITHLFIIIQLPDKLLLTVVLLCFLLKTMQYLKNNTFGLISNFVIFSLRSSKC